MEESPTMIGGGRRKKNVALLTAIVLLCILVAVVLVAILVPKGVLRTQTPTDRIECPGFDTAKECVAHGCVYDVASGAPSCYMDVNNTFGYTISELKVLPGGMSATLLAQSNSTPYGSPFKRVSFQVTYITENILRIKLRDADRERYEVPVQKEFPLLQAPLKNLKELTYEVVATNDSQVFSFQVKRTDGTVMWDSSIGGLVMSDQYLQIASYLPSSNIYGLGEHTHETLRHDLQYVTWPMFARDQPPIGGKINLYGVHPFYTCLEKSTKSHGVLLLNSNAMEATLLPDPAISFRTIGGVLDLFYFVGDNPEHVIQLYTSLVGRPHMPPLWALGFQLSRYGYNNLTNMKSAVERTRKAGIRQEVQFLDIDHMRGNRDFTFDAERFNGLVEYIENTKSEYGLKWIIILDPAIEATKGYYPYEGGVSQGVFVRRAVDWDPTIFPEKLREHNITYGKVWPNDLVAFPDFFNPEAKDWWNTKIVDYHSELPFDGLWIDMNEPANFGTNEDRPFYCQEGEKECWVLKCPSSPLEEPPYNPLKARGSDRLSKMTLCMDSVQFDGNIYYTHYDVHSLYGWSQTKPTLSAVESATGERSLVISRSTYPSSGRYAGHWLGDNKSTWEDLRRSIIGMLEFNLFGIPYVGADVCGFFGDTTPELCKRWMQVGAFYPFFRNHNGMGQKEQDPGVLGEKVARASKSAVERRYRLLPYLYTLFYEAHTSGSTVVRPLFHEFPADEDTWNNGQQFMWGRCLLVSPILNQGAESVRVYLPPSEEWWLFNYENSHVERKKEQWVQRQELSGNIPVHVRGGCIIPVQPYRMPQEEQSSEKEVELYVFLRDGQAEGEIFIDDGKSKDTVPNGYYAHFKLLSQNCTFSIKNMCGSCYSYDAPKVTYIHWFMVKFTENGSEVTKLTASVNEQLAETEFEIKNLPKSICAS